MELNRDNIKNMDPIMMLSIINMKLRDFYSSLENLCYDNDIDCNDIITRLKEAGYIYNKSINQFVLQ